MRCVDGRACECRPDLITGSHGSVVTRRPAPALQVDALLALFNDARIGIDQAGSRVCRSSIAPASRRRRSMP
jgi:hypothetical protein